tara:strand:+ start:5880 stop:6776 length:897 start_codon:yes stop_codon:yes gene_type:complete
MQIPPKLKANDEVIIIAPARKVDKKLLTFSLQLLKKWGLVPLLSKNLMQDNGIFAGSKILRHQDFQWALDHPSAKAIWCFRGGYGTTQIIEEINPARFLKNPKWIIGFSDITNFHCFSNIILNTASLHATMPINTQSNTYYTLNSLKNFLINQKISYKIKSNKENKLGEVEAALIGGNLSVLCATLGTNYQPDFENKILFIEDIDEYLYKIDRMIWQLKYAGIFHQIAGLIIGHFTNIKDNSISFGKSLEEIILEKVNEFNFPVIFDFPAGHENENLSIPFGMKLKLEAKNEYVKLYD